MAVMDSFYPAEQQEFLTFLDNQNIELPQGVCDNLSDAQFEDLYQSTIIHEKPLANALGSGFRDILTEGRVKAIFERM